MKIPRVFVCSNEKNSTTSTNRDKSETKAAILQVILFKKFTLKFPIVFLQILFSLFANFSVVTTGIGHGFPATTSQLLLQNDEVTLSQSQISWFASVTAIACIFGAPIAGFLSDKIGRKNTLMLINIISIISWLIITFSSRIDEEKLFIQLIIARILIGVAIGMITPPAVMYSSEICNSKLRGGMTVLSTPFFTAVGMLTVYLLGYLFPVSFKVFMFPFKQSFNYLDRLSTRKFHLCWNNIFSFYFAAFHS
jgi:MFS family permease